jgi:hypothetical protein
VLAFVAAMLVVFGITDMAAGATADEGILRALTGQTLAEVQAADPAGYRLYDFMSRTQGLVLAIVGLLSAAIVLIPYRAGLLWAWRVMWLLPAWAVLVPVLYVVYGTASDQPPAPPMVSGPIVAVLAAAALLIDRTRLPPSTD